MAFLKRLFHFFLFDGDRLVHSLKTAIAFLIGMLVVRSFDLPQRGQWVLITLLVVMCGQSRVGAILQKSYMRFLGTVLGACAAALTLWLVYPNIVLTTLILCIVTAIFSYIAASPSTLSEAGPLGAVTVVIILIGQDPSFTTVISRFLEINLGIVIALFVSRFIWPLHSRTQLRVLLVNTLQGLKELSGQLEDLRSKEQQEGEDQYAFCEDRIINQLVTQNKLISEVARESFGRSSLTQIFKDIRCTERELLRCINVMRYALMRFSKPYSLAFNQQADVKKIYVLNQALFQRSIAILEGKTGDNVAFNNILDWRAVIKQALNLLESNPSDQLAVDLFVFSAQHLSTQLDSLTLLIKKV